MGLRRDSGARKSLKALPVAFQDHFSGHAAAYADARPGYPDDLFAWLAAQSHGHQLAWDAGCGNGQASVALAGYFDSVVASDPSEAQIASAMANERVRYFVAAAEESGLPGCCADLITVAQAYHWFDTARFCAESRRVLKPGGLIAVWSYAQSEVSPDVDRVFNELHDVRLAQDWPSGRDHVVNRYRDLPFDVDRIATPAFEMRSEWNLHQYLAYLRSWSASQRHLARTGRDAVQEISDEMREAWGEPGLARIVRWPLLVLAGRP
ncbi:MAG: hypothetical protein A3E01_06265 [Gammaproteobacteria bacterium RIFCSPHIGHO2_12_FULL_63_22]|nr:MAG: hypothetical protein A3E01_06265 [Gammaproteobacteria bacterium RIFCSPHIGHO2_12_FULL_63_22]